MKQKDDSLKGTLDRLQEKEIYLKLVELKKMRENDLITEEEYEAKRKLLLGEI